MTRQLGFLHFLTSTDAVARAVLAILLIMSVATWTVILVRGLQGLVRDPSRRRFLERFWKADSFDQVAAVVREQGLRDPFANVVHHGLTALEQIRHPAQSPLAGLDSAEALLTRLLRRGIEQARRSAEFGLGVLASVASSAPFVGLFGTVWGVYQALVNIGQSGQGTLDRVAGPIGEALIMTGLGLVVAIPAVLAYNHFSRRTRHLVADLNSFAHDVYTLIGSGLKTPVAVAGGTGAQVFALAPRAGAR